MTAGRGAASINCGRAVRVGIADETEPRAALANCVRRALGLDPGAGEPLERPVEVVDCRRDVAVARAELVAALGRLEVVRQLELWDLATGNSEK